MLALGMWEAVSEGGSVKGTGFRYMSRDVLTKLPQLLASSLLSGHHEVRSRSPCLSDMMFQSSDTMAFLP